MNEQIKINWHRCKVDKKLMAELMKTSDLRGFCQVIPQLTLFLTTGTLAFLAYRRIDAANWPWSVPLVLLALFVHWTFTGFLGGGAAVHELCHKTPFRSKMWNEFFLRVYAFISWADYISFRPSHVKHHQATVHADYDGEVVLPQKFDWKSVPFFATVLICNPKRIYGTLRDFTRAMRGSASDWAAKGEWARKVVPESNAALRREHRNWARIVISGHLALAILFVATGNRFLLLLFTFASFFSGSMVVLCAAPQHIGMSPNVPDFRLCRRTYTCGRPPAFLYWNMRHHVEHHMFPAVPFYNLPKLRKAIEHDLPPVTHGLWPTWKEILAVVKRQREDPSYVFIPKLPRNHSGDVAGDNVLKMEAAASV